MITSIDISSDLLREAQELSGGKTKRAVVNEALAEYVCVRKHRRALGLFNCADFEADSDYKRARQSREG